MTEAQWLAATDPRPLLWFASTSGQLRHFAVACLRALGPYVSRTTGLAPLWRSVLDMADHIASGSATPDGPATLIRELHALSGVTVTMSEARIAGVLGGLLGDVFERYFAEELAGWAANAGFGPPGGYPTPQPGDDPAVFDAQAEQMAYHCALARDIIGNPFRPVALDPCWLTSDVLALCRGMFESRDFSALPILADALMDGGCAQDDILSHCRSDGPHVRGCWVVELLLGRRRPTGAERLRLVGLTDGFEGRESESLLRAGRLGSLEIVLDDSSVSRRHAVVFHNPDGWWVTDQGSTNGTFLNQTQIGTEPAGPLREGDVIQFGQVAFRVECATHRDQTPAGGAGPTVPPSGA